MSRAAKPKAPACLTCLLGEPHAGCSTAMFMLLTAVRVELLTVFGPVVWTRCERHKDPLASARKLAKPRRTR